MGPPWLYNKLDGDMLAQKAVNLLCTMQQWLSLRDINWAAAFLADHVRLSYWLCSNIPAADHTRLVLLAINCPNERLMRAIALLESFRGSSVVCRECRAQLSRAADVFAMSPDGVLNAFVNPNGAALFRYGHAYSCVGRLCAPDCYLPVRACQYAADCNV